MMLRWFFKPWKTGVFQGLKNQLSMWWFLLIHPSDTSSLAKMWREELFTAKTRVQSFTYWCPDWLCFMDNRERKKYNLCNVQTAATQTTMQQVSDAAEGKWAAKRLEEGVQRVSQDLGRAPAPTQHACMHICRSTHTHSGSALQNSSSMFAVSEAWNTKSNFPI